MRAGTAVRDISPAPGVELGGYPYAERANTGIHDPLVAGALFLDDERGGRCLLIATDLFWITRPQADEARSRIATDTGLPPEAIVVTCSHTHSAPWMSAVFDGYPGRPFETKVDAGYLDQVVDTLVAVGTAAVASTFAATVSHGSVRCGAEQGVGGNRRHPDDGPVDDALPVIVIRDDAGEVRLVWTKYSMHPTILHADNLEVSADFPAAMRAEVAAKWPGATFLYSMGTAGNQSPRYFRQGQTFAEADRFGGILGDGVVAAVAASQPVRGSGVRVVATTVELAVKEYPTPEVVEARVADLRRREADLVAADAPYVDRQNANLARLGAECDWANAIRQADGTLMDRYRRCAPYEVTVITIGDVALVFLPGEIFVEYGLDIVARSPMPQTYVVTLANGDLPGYCVTRDALEEGGYEPGNSILEPRSGDILVEAAVGLLADINNEEV